MNLVEATPEGLVKTTQDIVEECIYHGLTLSVSACPDDFVNVHELYELGYLHKRVDGVKTDFYWNDSYPVKLSIDNKLPVLYHAGQYVCSTKDSEKEERE